VSTLAHAVVVDFANVGAATAVFQVRSGNAADAPRTYTVEPQKHVSDTWSASATDGSAYDVSVYGPNGFLRAFKGSMAGTAANLYVEAGYSGTDIALTVTNRGAQSASARIVDRYSGPIVSQALPAGASMTRTWPLAAMFGWYDLTISVAEDTAFRAQFAGHVENGNPSISDPLMGGLV
jgi:phospholipase C